MTQVLARKWRPRSFAELVGQEHVVRALTNALNQQRLHHAYLFTGTRGVGKTTLARIIAKALNCETGITATPCGVCSACQEIDLGRFVDLVELDAASNTQVDNMRELMENALYAPSSGRFKVYIIDEVHMLSRNAFNAMLKTLEEPPAHVKFILATTDPQKIPVTVLSRCLQFNLKQIPPLQIVERLRFILEAEKLEGDLTALSLIARAAQGSLRDSLSLMDQAIAHGAGRVDEASTRDMLGAVDQQHLYAILEALSQADGPAMMQKAEQMSARSLSFESALIDLGSLLHQLALYQKVPQTLADDHPDKATLILLSGLFAPEELQLYYQITLQGRSDIGLAPDEYAGFTMSLLRMLAFHPSSDIAVPSSPSPRPLAVRAVMPSASVAQKSTHVTSPVTASAAPLPTQVKPALEASWDDIVRQLGLMGMTAQLAQNCALSRYTESEMELSIPKAQEMLLAGTQQQKLKNALQKLFGEPFKITFKVTEALVQTPALNIQKQKNEQLIKATQAISADPFVQQLQEAFGGNVKKSSIQPLS